MKNIFLSLLLFSSSIFAHTIHVNITNIQKNKKGQIVIGLFKDAKSFTKVNEAYRKITIPINSFNKISFSISNLYSAEYAIAIFHDENNNIKLDTNLFGIPKEGYGFSKNIRHKLRATSYKEAKFYLNKNRNITIKMGY